MALAQQGVWYSDLAQNAHMVAAALSKSMKS